MANTNYTINKSVNAPIEFKGLKAQYIWCLAIGLVGLMLVFALMYISGINPFVCIGVILIAGSFLFIYVYRLSNRYGPHGMMKKMARRSLPKVLKCYSRKLFFLKSEK
ncbi:MAG: hypothetical protein C5B59_10015 [Bacteroidetes bacterium]|nr:MAG: hypothetical protein C5B59_10015 [Bacteroidota bacterium]